MLTKSAAKSASVRELVALMQVAGNRDAVIEAILAFAQTTFDFVGIFLVQGQWLKGWRGPTPQHSQRLAKVTISISTPSVLQLLYATQGHYLGPLPDTLANQHLMLALERSYPRTAFLAPLLVATRLPAIVYADNAQKSVSTTRVAALLWLLQAAGRRLTELLQERKDQVRQKKESAREPWDDLFNPLPKDATIANQILPKQSPTWADVIAAAKSVAVSTPTTAASSGQRST